MSSVVKVSFKSISEIYYFSTKFRNKNIITVEYSERFSYLIFLKSFPTVLCKENLSSQIYEIKKIIANFFHYRSLENFSQDL